MCRSKVDRTANQFASINGEHLVAHCAHKSAGWQVQRPFIVQRLAGSTCSLCKLGNRSRRRKSSAGFRRCESTWCVTGCLGLLGIPAARCSCSVLTDIAKTVAEKLSNSHMQIIPAASSRPIRYIEVICPSCIPFPGRTCIRLFSSDVLALSL